MPIISLIILAWASQYSPNTMEQVVANRQACPDWVNVCLSETLPKTDGFIAVKDCSDIGEVWFIESPLTGMWESFLVADCARAGDGTTEWMEKHNIHMEVDYPTAVRWNTVGRGIKVNYTKVDPGVMKYLAR